MEEIDNLCYWDIRGYADFKSEREIESTPGSHMKKLKPTQKKMIEERKEMEKREKEKRNK